MRPWGADQVDSHSYRMLVRPRDLVSAHVRLKQTDLLVCGACYLGDEALSLAKECRSRIESYIRFRPEFGRSLEPVAEDEAAPEVVQRMIRASRMANVGPMAAVAGAVADQVGEGLLLFSRDIIVENGGDVFVRSSVRREMLVVSESSELQSIRIAIPPASSPCGVCTSSGRLGPSLSFGSADAVTVRAGSACLADAAATAIGNCIRSAADLTRGIELAKAIGVDGVLIIAHGRLGVWGEMELCA